MLVMLIACAHNFFRKWLHVGELRNNHILSAQPEPLRSKQFAIEKLVITCIYSRTFLAKRRSDTCLRCPGGQEGRLSPRRTVPSASRSARLRAAPRSPTVYRPASTNPWYARVLDSTKNIYDTFYKENMYKHNSSEMFTTSLTKINHYRLLM